MLNIGGMVQYVKSNGGVVLCNLNFQEAEAVPINKTKKRAILATILRNLKAPFSGSKTVIAGANLACTPLDIHTKATTYKDERGWFGDKQRTLKALPAGEQVFAGVKFTIYEMPTSPVPQVLMLGGNGVPGNLPQEITGIPTQHQGRRAFLPPHRAPGPPHGRPRAGGEKAFRALPLRHPLRRRPNGGSPIFCEIDIRPFPTAGTEDHSRRANRLDWQVR